MRVLRAHGMCSDALHAIYRSVVVAKITYASSAWWGFSTAADRQRIDAFFRRSKRCGMCPTDLLSFEEHCRTADSKLFRNVLSDCTNVLFKLLPPKSAASQNYNLRKRLHNRELTSSKTSLISHNFTNRMLFMDSYWANRRDILHSGTWMHSVPVLALLIVGLLCCLLLPIFKSYGSGSNSNLLANVTFDLVWYKFYCLLCNFYSSYTVILTIAEPWSYEVMFS